MTQNVYILISDCWMKTIAHLYIVKQINKNLI